MKRFPALLLLLLLLTTAVFPVVQLQAATGTLLENTIRELGSLPSRSTGSAGYERATEYVEEQLETLGLEPASHYYTLPVRTVKSASITLGGTSHPLRPFLYNAVTPGTTDGTLRGRSIMSAPAPWKNWTGCPSPARSS